MNSIEDFLTPYQEQDIIKSIVAAEKNTSGEIRVHLENHCSKSVKDRALEVFSILNMHETKLKNAVLIYLAVLDKTFYVYGDEGIDKVVPYDFWESTKNILETHFKAGQFHEGLVKGIQHIGIKLQDHFPWKDDDQNEITNTISKS